MITLYTSSLWIGGIVGFVLGTALSFLSAWAVEKQIPSEFARGWDAGVKYGKESMELKQMKEAQQILEWRNQIEEQQ